jgi:NitT/TauT family transport system substrate-binding protein
MEKLVVISRRSLLLSAAATFGLAACGGTTPQASSMTLKVMQNSSAFSYFVPYVAQQQGFFREADLALDPSPIPVSGNGAKTAPAIEAGNVEVAIGTTTDAFTLSRIDANIKIIGSVCNAFLIDIIASKHFLASTGLTEASPLERKVKALVGKKIGISSPNTATEGLLIYLLRQYGFDYQHDITEVILGSVTPTTALSALSSGRIDAVSWPSPAGQVAEVQGIGKLFISPVLGDVPAMRGQLYGVLYARQQIIDAKPKAVQAFIRAIAQAEAFIQKNPARTITLLGKFLKLDQKTVNIIWRAAKASMPLTPQISSQRYGPYDVANAFHVKAGLITTALSYNDLIATDAINQALVPIATTTIGPTRSAH